MATLGPAVSSLRASLALLDSSISILDEGVADFPRLRKVLQTQQHFELVPETTLRAAQQSLAEEISPAVEQLLSTAETYVDQLARREQSLKARYELLEGRFGSARDYTTDIQAEHRPTSSASRPSMPGNAKSSQMKKLQQKRDQLHFAIERLELQSKQKERELRKSMAFVRE